MDFEFSPEQRMFRDSVAGFAARELAPGALERTRSDHIAADACAKFLLAKEHVAHRHQFGRPLMEFQGLQWRLAECAVALDAAQLLLYRAASDLKDGLPDPHQTAMAKLACNRAGYEAADQAMQAMRALGFSEDSLAQYCYRRTRGWMIAGGSVEMMLNRIAEGVFGRRFSQSPQAAK